MNNYDKTKKNYDDGIEWHIKKSLSYNWENQIDRFIKSLNGKKILDAGCGGGRDIKEFIKRGLEVSGIDYSKNTIKVCRKKFPEAKFYEGDIRKMELPSNNYDGVWACASILNLKKEDVSVALSEFKRVLKSGGKLFISVKEGKGERIIPDKLGGRFFSFYSLDELKKLVEKAGFKITCIEVVLMQN